MKNKFVKILLICLLGIIGISYSFETGLNIGTLDLTYNGNRYISDSYAEIRLNFYRWYRGRFISGYNFSFYSGDFQIFSVYGADIGLEINYIAFEGFGTPMIFLFSGYIPPEYRYSNRFLVCLGGGFSFVEISLESDYGYNAYICLKWYYITRLGIGMEIKNRVFSNQNLLDYTFNVLILF